MVEQGRPEEGKTQDAQGAGAHAPGYDGNAAHSTDLEQLFQNLSEAYPDLRIRAVQPMAAKAFLVVQNGAFSAVLIRPTEQGLQLKAGLPPSGIGGAFGPLGLSFQRRRRAALLQRVQDWASGKMG